MTVLTEQVPSAPGHSASAAPPVIPVGVIGCGYWGPNLIRNFASLEEYRLVGVCDMDGNRARAAARRFGVSWYTDDADALIESPDIEAIAIATPISTHATLAKKVLRAGKHVIVEKPLAASVADCDELIQLADEQGVVLLVDHTYLYTGSVECIRRAVEGGELGDIFYFDSVRVNLGLFQHDYNVLWDLAPHDLSIMLHLLPERPTHVAAVGAAPFPVGRIGLESVAYLTLTFPSGMIGHVHVNWLAPVKIRLTLIGGSKRMVVWDDVEPDTKVKIFDRGLDLEMDRESIYKTLVQYRMGDMWAPRIERTEALRSELMHFRACILGHGTPRSGGRLGRAVVAVLEAAQQSLGAAGSRVTIAGW
jgi:predicted dehydrogenase